MNLSLKSAINRLGRVPRVIAFYIRNSGSGFFLTPTGFKYIRPQ